MSYQFRIDDSHSVLCWKPQFPILACVVDEALTSREIDVLRLIVGGNANKLIGDQLSITEGTVKGYVKSILSKLGAKDRTHAVTVALKRGIIDL